jgi:hypothetical protein
MAKLHFFYPENDLALALNDANYTAPAAAVDLRNSGDSLPLWFADSGDRFFSQGVNANWYDAIANAFNIDVDIFNGDIDNLTPAPWGWSLPVRKYFSQLGFDDSQLPSPQQIMRMRDLSHRRAAAIVAKQLADSLDNFIGAPAIETSSTDEVLDYIHSHERAMLKLPWSSSGRGVVDTLNLSDDEIVRRALGTIRRQGSVMLEPFYDSPQNFAYLYYIGNGIVSFKGYSLFSVDSHCAYSGSTVAANDTLEQLIAQHTSLNNIRNVRQALIPILQNVIGTDYCGPLGVDMMIADNTLAVAEINLRNTMGHVALSLATRYMADNTVGTFTIQPRTDNIVALPRDCDIDNHKIYSGTLDLVPPDRRHRFLLTIN